MGHLATLYPNHQFQRTPSGAAEQSPYVAKNIVDELNVRYPGIVVEVQNG